MTGPAAKTPVAIQPEPRQRVRAMKEYHPPLGKRDLLRLDFNENTFDCSPKVREVLSRHFRRGSHALSGTRAG